MEKEVNLSEGLLSLIVMVQRYQKLLIYEKIFKEQHNLDSETDWNEKTQKYFNSIDSSILEKYGLCKNKISFECVMEFKITPEMLETELKDLHKFKCWSV
jgi:hypothetical protein